MNLEKYCKFVRINKTNEMRNLTSLFVLFLFLTGNAQNQKYALQTKKGNADFYPIVHGSMVFTFDDLTVAVDPYGGAERFNAFEKFDYVLITDIHGDHYNPKTLDGLNLEDTKLIVPPAVYDLLSERYQSRAIVMKNGDSGKIGSIKIEAIPMYNLPESSESRHTKGRGNGYVLKMGGKHIYISGDTEDIQEMRSLKRIDLAFVCMNLPYTMDINQASSAVLEFKPKVVVPYHYRGKEMSDIEAFKSLVNEKDTTIEVMLYNWYL